tara:strand:+ start:145 stop:585 length:441 start_codon:yes stop_codon:yes gene_type:complete
LAAGIIFLLSVGQQLLAFWLQEGASSETPRLGLVSIIFLELAQLPQQDWVLAALLHCDLQALAHEEAQLGALSAALRLGVLLEPEFAQPAMARTRLMPRVLSMNFIDILQDRKGLGIGPGGLDCQNIAVKVRLGDAHSVRTCILME